MKNFCFYCALSLCLLFQLAQAKQNTDLILISQINRAFDPFIDHGEFKEKIAEQQNIMFFQNGRSLNIMLAGGYEAITFNLAQIYGDSPLTMALSLGFFLDLNFALQINGFSSNHYNSLLNKQAQFYHVGLDFKYYFNKQYFGKEKHFFNPYFSAGPVLLTIANDPGALSKTQKKVIAPVQKTTTSSAVPTVTTAAAKAVQRVTTAVQGAVGSSELQATQTYKSFGLKFSFGFEIPIIKQTFMGMELFYFYTNLEFENDSNLHEKNLPSLPRNFHNTLIEKRQFPDRPQVKGYRFFGDIAGLIILFGVNF